MNYSVSKFSSFKMERSRNIPECNLKLDYHISCQKNILGKVIELILDLSSKSPNTCVS